MSAPTRFRWLSCTLLLTVSLTLLTSFLHIFGIWWYSVSVIRDEWVLWLPILQVLFMAGLLWRLGRPPGWPSWSLFLLCNLWLLGVEWLASRNEWRSLSLLVIEFAVRVSVAGGWIFGLLGFVAWMLWLQGRHRWSSRRAPIWIKVWFAVLLGLVFLEGALRVLIVPAEIPANSPLSLHVHWKPAEDQRLRIVALGGSTTLGFPYHPKLDIGTVFADRLRQGRPELETDLINLAINGGNFEKSAERLQEVDIKPSIILVYTGHNEFFYDIESAVHRPISPTPWLDDKFAWSRAYTLSCQALVRLKGTDYGVQKVRREILRRPLFPASVLAQRLKRFRSQLERFAEFCRDEGIATLWILPASSEGVFEPNRSSLGVRPWAFQERQLQRDLNAARHWEQAGDWKRAEQQYLEILKVFPQVAEVHFRHGECLATLHRYDEAQKAFRRASDLDDQPAQARSEYRDAIRDIADRFQIPWIDAAEVLRPLTPHGLLDRSVIHDNVHPTLRGHFALGTAAADRPEVRDWVDSHLADPDSVKHDITNDSTTTSKAPSEYLDPALEFDRLIRDRGIAADDLALAYERTAWCLSQLSTLQSDPTRRKAEAAIYLSWAEKLRQGVIRPGEDGTEFLTSAGPPGVRLPEVPRSEVPAKHGRQ